MNFDDRLRSQLRAQSEDLTVASDGVEGVRARSHRRKQQRTGGAMLATVAVALLVGGWFIGQSGDDAIQVATDGDGQGAASAAVSSVASPDPDVDVDVDRALPEAGTPLTLTAANTEDAPGGYNLYETGRADGLYFVVSTAPGITWEDADEFEYIRPDTFYTFDGSSWSSSDVGDRYVSSFDTGANGVLYAMSTGSSTGQSLEIGSSTNGGRDWDWTEIDLTSMFGDDRATWPGYSVQFADRDGQGLAVVHTNGNVNWEEATATAIANGAAIDPAVHEVVYVDRDGIAWIDQFDGRVFGFEQTECEAAFSDAQSGYWESEDFEDPFPFREDRPLTEAEKDQLRAIEAEQRDRYLAFEAETVEAIAADIPGCELFAECTLGMTALSLETDRLVTALYADMGYDIYDWDYELTSAQTQQIDALYAEREGEFIEWLAESGCDEVFPYHSEGEGAIATDELVEPGYNEQYASWESLGVVPPESWNETNRAFMIDDESVSDLGEVFGDQPGYLVDVRSTEDGWSATFDSTPYGPGFDEVNQQFTEWSSTDLVTWNSRTTTTIDWLGGATMADGTTFTVDWTAASSELIRRTPNGMASRLALADLAPELDTEQFELLNVQAGAYGVVAWAVKWPEFDERTGASTGTYESIVLYSPDGVGWGATEVPDVEVVDVIVGEDNALIFLNDPERTEGTPQPILLASAE